MCNSWLTKTSTQRSNQALWLVASDFAFLLDVGTIDIVSARHAHQATVETFWLDYFAWTKIGLVVNVKLAEHDNGTLIQVIRDNVRSITSFSYQGAFPRNKYASSE